MRYSLLVDASYKPLRFIEHKRLASLLCRDRVEILSTWENVPIHPAFRLENYPAVIRLNDWSATSIRIQRFSRMVMFARDKLTCQYCHKKLTFNEATIDHVVPKCAGGRTSWSNCVTACRMCNRYKGGQSLEKSGMKLLKQPIEPTSCNIHDFHTSKRDQYEWHPDWNFYVRDI